MNVDSEAIPVEKLSEKIEGLWGGRGSRGKLSCTMMTFLILVDNGCILSHITIAIWSLVVKFVHFNPR